MADIKKISELSQIQSLSNDDEFVVVDKSTTNGNDSSSSGKTSRVTLSQLKQAVGASGPKGDKGDQGIQGDKGDKGDQGIQGDKGDKGDQGIQGDKGEQGDQGDRGLKGDKGDQGAKGNIGEKGERGSPGQTGAQGPVGPVGNRGLPGQTGPVGDVGEKGQAGSKGQRGEIGSQGPSGVPGIDGKPGNANNHLKFIGSGASISHDGNSIRKTISNGTWDAGIFSSVSFSRGAYCSFSTFFYPIAMIGLTREIGRGPHYSHIDYAFYVHSDKAIRIYEKGNQVAGSFGTYSPSDTFSVVYDNHSVYYYLNNQLKRTVKAPSNLSFHLGISIHSGDTNLRMVTDYLSAGHAPSIGKSGEKGATGLIGQKGQQGISVKGQKGQQGISVKGQKGHPGVSVKGQKGHPGTSIRGQKGSTGASGNPFTGGTFSGSCTFNKSITTANYAQIKCGSHMKVDGVTTCNGSLRCSNSITVGGLGIKDSLFYFRNKEIEGDKTHIGRIMFSPSYGQATYRVRGMIDFRTTKNDDNNPTPIVRIQGAYTSSSFRNAVLHNNRLKFEVKGTADFTGYCTSPKFTQTSDISLKQQINEIESTESLDTIMKFRPVTFKWKSSQNIDNKNHFGFIAQQIEEIEPNLVDTIDNVKSVAYSEIIPLLVSTIQNQQKRLEKLENLIKNQ